MMIPATDAHAHPNSLSLMTAPCHQALALLKEMARMVQRSEDAGKFKVVVPENLGPLFILLNMLQPS